MSADSQRSHARSAQTRMDAAIANLKAEAARLGANGILLSGAGDQYAGSLANGSGFITGIGNTMATPNPAGAFWTGASFSTPVYYKSATGIAIFVMQ